MILAAAISWPLAPGRNRRGPSGAPSLRALWSERRDQAEDLARCVAAELGLPWSYALERRTRTIAQHALGRSERAANLGGAQTDPRRYPKVVDSTPSPPQATLPVAISTQMGKPLL